MPETSISTLSKKKTCTRSHDGYINHTNTTFNTKCGTSALDDCTLELAGQSQIMYISVFNNKKCKMLNLSECLINLYHDFSVTYHISSLMFKSNIYSYFIYSWLCSYGLYKSSMYNDVRIGLNNLNKKLIDFYVSCVSFKLWFCCLTFASTRCPR